MIKCRGESTCKVKIGWGVIPVLAVCGVSLLTEYGRGQAEALFCMVLASVCHEWGHFVMARAVNVPLAECRLDLLGARLQPQGTMSYVQEWWLCAGGPLFNFLSVALLLPLWLAAARSGWACPEWIVRQLGTFLVASLGLGVLNLMPIDSFDGGRMVRCALSLFVEERTAYRVSLGASFICLIFLWMLSVYVLLRVGRSLSMFVFSFTLLYRGLGGYSER